MSRPDGGPAFPYTNCEDHGLSGGYGMSLRDYFAGRALQGILAGRRNVPDKDFPMQDVVLASFEFADAMIAQREAP